MDNSGYQLDAAVAGAEDLEPLDDELELELSDLPESDFFSDEPDELDVLDDSELFEEPLDEALAASRLSVR